MTRSEIVNVKEYNEECLPKAMQTLLGINKFFIYSLILNIALESKPEPTIKQVCEILTDNAFALRKEDNKIVMCFNEIGNRYEPLLKDDSAFLYPHIQILTAWAELRAVCDLMGSVISKARDGLKEKFPNLPYPFRGLVAKLNSASDEAERSSDCIKQLVQKLKDHDLKLRQAGELTKYEERAFDPDFDDLTTEASHDLSPIMRKLDESTIRDLQKVWPKGQLKKIFLDIFSGELDTESEDQYIKMPDFGRLDCLKQIPEERVLGRITRFNMYFVRYYVIGIILAVTLDWESSESAFEKLCKNYLPAVGEIKSDKNIVALYLDEVKRQLQPKLQNPEKIVVPEKSVMLFWLTFQPLIRLLGEGINKSYKKIQDNFRVPQQACADMLSILQSAYMACFRIDGLLESIVDKMLNHNDEVTTPLTVKEEANVVELKTFYKDAENLSHLANIYIQDLSEEEIDTLQSLYPTDEADEIDLEFFKPFEDDEEDF